MSTAVPEQRNAPVLSDEQVIELDRWYPYTAGRAVVYAAWLYFVAIGAVTAFEMHFSLLRDGLNYLSVLPVALGSATGLYLSRGNRRDRVRNRLSRRKLEWGSQNQHDGPERAEPLTPAWKLVAYAVSIGFALFGILSLMSHLDLYGPLTWFAFAMCFMPVIPLMWFLSLGRGTHEASHK